MGFKEKINQLSKLPGAITYQMDYAPIGPGRGKRSGNSGPVPRTQLEMVFVTAKIAADMKKDLDQRSPAERHATIGLFQYDAETRRDAGDKYAVYVVQACELLHDHYLNSGGYEDQLPGKKAPPKLITDKPTQL